MPAPKSDHDSYRCLYCGDTFPVEGRSVETADGYYHRDCYEFLQEDGELQ